MRGSGLLLIRPVMLLRSAPDEVAFMVRIEVPATAAALRLCGVHALDAAIQRRAAFFFLSSYRRYWSSRVPGQKRRVYNQRQNNLLKVLSNLSMGTREPARHVHAPRYFLSSYRRYWSSRVPGQKRRVYNQRQNNLLKVLSNLSMGTREPARHVHAPRYLLSNNLLRGARRTSAPLHVTVATESATIAAWRHRDVTVQVTSVLLRSWSGSAARPVR